MQESLDVLGKLLVQSFERGQFILTTAGEEPAIRLRETMKDEVAAWPSAGGGLENAKSEEHNESHQVAACQLAGNQIVAANLTNSCLFSIDDGGHYRVDEK